MAMETDNWPYNPDWNGRFQWTMEEGDSVDSSRWRPVNHCAVWEETYHTITEAFNRLSVTDPSNYGDWEFSKQSPLGKLLKRDIQEGTYETARQNKAERGRYDFVTAINEWVHQIWLCWIAGHENKLSGPQSEALQIIKNTPAMPFA